MRVLVIEDDRDIATNLYDYLEAQGHIMDAAGDGLTGLHLAIKNDYDVILLDLSLPGIDGLTVCRRLRGEANKDVPILMVTARDTLDDKLRGFAEGADDYIVKPFALKEIEARLHALHKRHRGRLSAHALQLGALNYDSVGVSVDYAGTPIKLSPKCLQILELLMRESGRVFRRRELEIAVWGEVQQNSDTLRSHMSSLRTALEAAGAKGLIHTVHGIGYKIALTDEA